MKLFLLLFASVFLLGCVSQQPLPSPTASPLPSVSPSVVPSPTVSATLPPFETYCEQDSDCVRRSSCCDCGLGYYMNEAFYKEVTCEYQCACASTPSRGVCVQNKCEAVQLECPVPGTGINCFPGPDVRSPYCEQKTRRWVENSCPNVQYAD